MKHWSDEYIGWEYREGGRDCAGLVIEVLADKFDRHIDIPRDRATGIFSAAASFSQIMPDIAHQTNEPEDGDMVLMNVGNRTSHVGLYAVINGEPHVLHALKSFGAAIRHPLKHVQRFGLSIEGFYKYAEQSKHCMDAQSTDETREAST